MCLPNYLFQDLTYPNMSYLYLLGYNTSLGFESTGTKLVISGASDYDAHGGEKEQLPLVPPFVEVHPVQEMVRALGHAPTVEQKV